MPRCHDSDKDVIIWCSPTRTVTSKSYAVPYSLRSCYNVSGIRKEEIYVRSRPNDPQATGSKCFDKNDGAWIRFSPTLRSSRLAGGSQISTSTVRSSTFKLRHFFRTAGKVRWIQTHQHTENCGILQTALLAWLRCLALRFFVCHSLRLVPSNF